ISHFAGTVAGSLPCPLMIVPGAMSAEALDRLS
ncbi:MAG TPA: universal stress protein, partial [Allosphingosinicella sp.]|nr:universal stress protein [Allosphingosinicella sp.]